MFNIQELFQAARVNPRHPMNRPGKLMGKHCVARTLRAQARRTKLNRGHGVVVRHKKVYAPYV